MIFAYRSSSKNYFSGVDIPMDTLFLVSRQYITNIAKVDMLEIFIGDRRVNLTAWGVTLLTINNREELGMCKMLNPWLDFSCIEEFFNDK